MAMLEHVDSTAVWDWDTSKRDENGVLDGIFEPPGTKGQACGSLVLMVDGVTTICPMFNRAFCHSKEGTNGCGAEPTAWWQLAEMMLFDYLLLNNDR